MKRIVFIILVLFHFLEVYSQDNIKHRYVVSRIFTQYPFAFTSTSTATFRFDGTTILHVTAVADDNPEFFRIQDMNIMTFNNKLSQFGYYSDYSDNSNPNAPPPCTENGIIEWEYNGEIFGYQAECFMNGAASVRALYIDSFANNNNWFDNTELNLCEPIELRVMPDVDPDWNINFEVEYSINGVSFQNLFPRVKDERFMLSYEDILSKEPDFDIESDILFLRLKYFANDEATTSNEYSDIITYHFIDCAPALTSGPFPIDTKCSYSDDGSFTVQFERAMVESENERMLVYVEREISSGVWDAETSYIVPTNLSMSGTNLTWPEELETGTYRLRWITKEGEDPDSRPDSDRMSNTFTIDPPPLLEVGSVLPSQPVCPGDSGSITVTGSGGVPPYEYSIEGGAPDSWQASGSFSPLSPGDYTVVVMDSNGCISPTSVPVEIETPVSAPSIGPVFVTPPTAHGESWSIDISVLGGVGDTYEYTWTMDEDAGFSADTEDISNADVAIPLEGTATFRVRAFDSRGCASGEEFFVVTEPAPLGITFNEPVAIACFGGVGSIRAQGTGGFLGADDNYTYSWSDNGSTAPVRHNLSPGTYTVTVTDANNNSETKSHELKQPNELVVGSTPNTTMVNCRGGDTGAIELTITGGTGTYSVSWSKALDDSFSRTGSSINNLTAGIYTYQVTDKNGCTVNNNATGIEITEPNTSLIVSEITSSHIDNNIYGGSIGELVITANGGVGEYTYSWTKDGEVYPGDSNTLTSLPAGEYQVTVTDGIGCAVNFSATITEPAPLEITSAVPTHVNCFGESTGSIALTVTGGMPPYQYQYQWSKLDDDDFSAPDTNEITGLSQGTYEVTVTDESGSPAATSTTVIISQQPQIQITHTNEDNICYNDNQGSIDLTVTGGVPPYSYQWSNGETTQDISGLQSGSYTVEVTDALGCESNYDVTIGQPADAVGLIFDVSQITAYGYNNGAIDITVTGGAPPYVYEWIANNGFASANEDISGLEPGDYTLIVYDANYETSGSVACTVMEEFEIREPAELLVNISEEYSLFCYGDQNGELLANVTGGVTPYSYQWYRVENGITLDQNIQTPFITDIGQGNYRVVITDDNGIEVTSEDYQLSHPDELILQTISTTNVLCYGDATGAIDMQVSGGVIPHTITWNDGATTLDRENLTAGIYTITVEDANGCSKETTVEIIHPYQELRIEQVDVTDVTRFDGNDGSLSVAFSGGASPHGITWTRESTQTIQGNTATITNLMAGDYTVVITDANGCSVSQTYSVTEPDIVEATLINPTCAGLCDASLSLAIIERPGNYTYTWNNGSTSSTLTGLCAGTYTVLIGGFGDRILERTYEIIDPAPLVVDLGEDRVLCQGQTHSVNAAIADAGALYQWTSDTGFSSASPQAELTQPGTYSLTVTSSLGCIGTDAITISRTIAVIGAQFAVSSQVFTGESVVLVDLSNPTPDVIEWVLPEGAEVITSETGYAEVVFKEAGEYVFGMYTELGECQAYQEKRVVVIEREKFTEGEGGDVSENDKNSLIENYVVYPNPSDGAFTLEIGLSEEKSVSVRIFGLVNNAMVDYRNLQNNKDYLIEYDLRHVSAGIYFIVLETPVSTQVKKLIIE